MRTNGRLMVLLAALSACALPLAAQEPAVLRGQVVDAGTGQAVPGAVVHVGSDRLGVADGQGRFVVSRLTAGQHVVWATALGYAMGNAEVEVPFDSLTVTLALEPDPVRLAAIVATASRFDSRTRGYARSMRVFREEQIRTAASADMREFVMWRAGLRRASCGVGRVCVMVRGQAISPAVYIDEVRLMAGMDLLSTLRPSQVARVEVYNGGAQVRVYTKSFMEWAARTNYQPLPLSLGGA